jgi:hypothetical protein
VSQLRVGSYVTHTNKPEWGIGKVFCMSAPYVLVGFEHLPPPDQFKRLVALPGMLTPAPVKSNPVLDAWSVEGTQDCRVAAVREKPKRKAKKAT